MPAVLWDVPSGSDVPCSPAELASRPQVDTMPACPAHRSPCVHTPRHLVPCPLFTDTSKPLQRPVCHPLTCSGSSRGRPPLNQAPLCPRGHSCLRVQPPVTGEDQTLGSAVPCRPDTVCFPGPLGGPCSLPGQPRLDPNQWPRGHSQPLLLCASPAGRGDTITPVASRPSLLPTVGFLLPC